VGNRVTRDADTVHGVMTTDVATMSPADPVRAAIGKMLERDIGSVVVVDEGVPIGVFTERDVTRRVLEEEGLLDRPVADVMSGPPVTAEVNTAVEQAFELMNRHGIRRIPIVADGLLVGIVTEGDLRRWVEKVANE
jgi:CBS domain-containing protein